MAHANYDCCARCNNKMGWNPYGEEAKSDLCSSCAVELSITLDTPIATRDELLERITAASPAEITDMKIAKCYYTNDIDLAVTAKGGEFSD